MNLNEPLIIPLTYFVAKDSNYYFIGALLGRAFICVCVCTMHIVLEL